MDARTQATQRTLEDNDRVVITEYRFAPGAETGWHHHARDYVVVYRTPGHMSVQTKQGTNPVDIAAGQSMFRKAGVEHNVANAGGEEVVFVEIELK